jgi:SET domain-containing protein
MRINEIYSPTVVSKSKIPNAGNGLFATENIPAGTLFVINPIITISESDWNKIKDTVFVKRMRLSWTNNEKVLPVGNIEYKLSPEDIPVFRSTDRFKNGVFVSPFLLVNHSDDPNSEQVIDVAHRMVGLRAVKFIEQGEEITKRYDGFVSKKSASLDFD